MSLKSLRQIVSAVLCALVFVGPPAFADLTITTQSWAEVSSSPLASAKRALAGPFGTMTQYIGGGKSRTDFFGFSEITDGKKAYMLNRAEKSYIAIIGDASQLNKFLSSGISQMQSLEAPKTDTVSPMPGHKGDYIIFGEGASYTNIELDIKPKVLKIIDTGQTTSYLGHSVDRYIEIMQEPLDSSSKPVKVREVILVATDFPPADVEEYKKACSDDTGEAVVPGIPLKITTYIPAVGFAGGFPEAGVCVQAVTAISTRSLAESVFAVPPAYTQSEAGQKLAKTK